MGIINEIIPPPLIILGVGLREEIVY